MHTVLAALLLAAQPAPAAADQNETTQLALEWGHCIGASAIGTLRRETETTVEAAVDRAFSECDAHESRVRASWVKVEGEAVVAAHASEFRTSLRQRAVERVRAMLPGIRP